MTGKELDDGRLGHLPADSTVSIYLKVTIEMGGLILVRAGSLSKDL